MGNKCDPLAATDKASRWRCGLAPLIAQFEIRENPGVAHIFVSSSNERPKAAADDQSEKDHQRLRQIIIHVKALIWSVVDIKKAGTSGTLSQLQYFWSQPILETFTRGRRRRRPVF